MDGYISTKFDMFSTFFDIALMLKFIRINSLVMNKSEKLKKIRDGLVLLSREREVVLSFHETFHMVDELLEIVDDLIEQESKS